MKRTKILCAAFSVILAASCSKEFGAVDTQSVQQIPQGCKAVTFDVQIDDLTKSASLGSDLSVTWEVGDSVAVIDTATSVFYGFRVSSVSGKNAVIAGVVADSTKGVCAVYPMAAATKFASGLLTVTIPDTQVIPAGRKIDGNSLVSVARAGVGEALSFRNVVSLVKFSASAAGYNTLTLKGNSGDKFVGKCKESGDTLAPAGTLLTVSAPEGFEASQDYYAAICPATFTTGFTTGTLSSTGLYVKKTEKTATFAKNGGLALGSLTTSGSAIPTTISTKAELDSWAANAASFPQGAVIKLAADIDYGQGTWTPACGVCTDFDGQGHSIYNLSIGMAEGKYMGFIGKITGDAKVQDLKLGYDPAKSGYDGFSKAVYSTVDDLNPYLGGAIGGVISGNVEVLRVDNYVPITVTIASTEKVRCCVAGIVGVVASGPVVSIKSCKNYGAFSMEHTAKPAEHQYLGGMVGLFSSSDGRIESCINYADIEGAKTTAVTGNVFVGGMIGRVSSDDDNITIKGCVNSGNLSISTNLGDDDYAPYIGGIIGSDNKVTGGSSPKTMITACINSGKISCPVQQEGGCSLGGIMGYMYANSLIEACVNDGEIASSIGKPSVNPYVGGIVGKTVDTKNGNPGSTEGWLTNCVNNGYVHEDNASAKTVCIGGIAGIAYTNIKDCTNNGKVECASTSASPAINLGGITGIHGAYALTGCKNYGDVKISSSKTSSACGGIMGRQNDVAVETLAGCEVNCKVTCPSATISGMIVGSYNSKTPTVVFGTPDSKVKVGGTINDTAITADNYTTYLAGGANANATYNAEFIAAK